MAKRSFNDNFWGDNFVQDIEKDAKLLFAYLWTNKRCNSAGLYEITLKTICFETGISIDDLPRLFKILESRVKWQSETNTVWVRNFLKHQPKSPLFLKSVAICLTEVNANGMVKEFLDYYGKQGVSIPFGNGIDTVSIPISNGIPSVSKGNGMETVSIPFGYLPEQEQELYIEQELYNGGIVKGGKAQANRLLADDKNTSFEDYIKNTLTEEFNDIDISGELKRFKLWWSEGKRELKRPKVAFRNWLINARKFKAEGKQNGTYQQNNKQASRGKVITDPSQFTRPEDY